MIERQPCQRHKYHWSNLTKIVSFLVLAGLTAFSGIANAVETEKPGEYTILDADRHLKSILGELPIYDPATKTFTPEVPPSATLKQAVTELETEWKNLYDNSDLHDIAPPGRARILQRCDDLKTHLTAPTRTKHTLETERFKLEQRERFVDSARKQVELRNWTVFVFAMGNLGKEAFNSFKKILSPSPKDVKKLYEGIVKKMVQSARKSASRNPGGTAIASADEIKLGENGNKYFVEREAEIIKRVNDYILKRKFTQNELRNPEQIQKEIFIHIRDYLKSLAILERDDIRKRIQQIDIELTKYSHITLPAGAFSFVDYEPWCNRVRDLKDWKRTMVSLRINPPKVQIEVGETTKPFEAIGKYSNGKGREVYATHKVNWPDGNSFTGITPGKFSLKAEYRSLTATAEIIVVPSTKPAPPPAGKCPAGKIEVPYVIRMQRTPAEGAVKSLGLQLTVVGQEPNNQFNPGEIIDQVPYAGDCVDPKTSIRVKLAVEVPETALSPLSAELNCGRAIEIEAGAEPSRICGIVVRGWKPEGKVTVSVTPIPSSSGIRIFPGNTSLEAFNMHTTGPSDFHDRYIFDQLISAKGSAPEGMTGILFTVTQEGHGSVSLPLNISVLPSGRSPSRGGGVRPPVEPATGSSGGLYCVWRSKSFGDGPNCFNINRAQCDNPKYAGNPKYELVGSGMTPMESAALASRLSPYKGDAYGCHSSPPEGQEPGGGPEHDGGAGTGRGPGESGASGSDSGEDTGKGEGTGESESTEKDQETEEGEDAGESEGAGENQGANGGEEDNDLLAGFPDAPGDAPPADEDPITPEQAEAVEGFDESGPTSHLPPSDPDQMVSEDTDGTPPVDIAEVAQAERDKDEARNREREGIQRDEARQADDDRQTINQQNAQDQQAQDAAAQQAVTQAQAQGQVMIDQASQNADPIMSGQDMAGAIDKIQQEGEDKIEAIDDQIRQGLGGSGQGGGGQTRQPLPPPPSMGTGPVDTAVVQCNAKYGAGGDNPGFYTIDFSGATGVANFEYDTESIKDEMEVNAGGATFNTTCRSNGETVPITIPSPNTPVTVTVKPNCDCKKPPCKGTHWSFTFHCPTSAGAPASGSAQPVIPQGGVFGQ